MADQNSEYVDDQDQEYSDDSYTDTDTDTDQDEQYVSEEEDQEQTWDADQDDQSQATQMQETDGSWQERQVARTNGNQDRAVATRKRYVPGRGFNPMGAIRAGHLRLARSWAETGSIYAAIAAYMDIVERYPGSGAARAATEGLLELAQMLEGYGMYYTAQNIFRQLEQVVWE